MIKTSTSTVKSTSAWNRKIPFPKDNYVMRVRDESVYPNSNGNSMVELEWEIVNQAPKQIGDEIFEFDGQTFKTWHVIKVLNKSSEEENKKSSDSSFSNYEKRILVPCKAVKAGEAWDDENPPPVKGKVVWTRLYGKKVESFDPPTAEDLAAGRKVGAVAKDPITGQPLVEYQIQIDQIFGLYEGEVKNPF